LSSEEIRYLTAEQRARLAALEEQQRKENSIDISNPQVSRIVPASGKIYDITEADTNEHSVALPAGYPANTKALHISPRRIAGTGSLKIAGVQGNTAANHGTIASQNMGLWPRAVDGLFYYRLGTASDVWEIDIIGYFIG